MAGICASTLRCCLYASSMAFDVWRAENLLLNGVEWALVGPPGLEFCIIVSSIMRAAYVGGI